ncbi:hypothetical protein V565_246230 [Rhizoctonia solani 123E]|uniref:Uncharacterized protein n=1 Tax=Rhizoctonia solani 123E TaxID=1423351 RepID=A0A074RF68_9AGAM|nr:hypothetical protein V565_246230 [Rhizoctonia solani 123E]
MTPSPKVSGRTSDALKHIAVLAQSLPQRIQTFRIKSESASRKLSCSYEERHKQIFPAGFDSISSSNSTQRLCYYFSPQGLYDVLTSSYHPEHHVEDIIVKSASYCKKNTSPKHEFIVLEVEDRRSPGLRNFIVLDRNINEADRPTGILASVQSSRSLAAMDDFRVSYDGDRKRLLVQCDLQNHETLETLTFKSSEPLLLYQLATLTRAVSSQREKYHVIAANCYWFAGLIWDCMVRMRPLAHHKVSQGQIRGAFTSWIRQSTNSAELQVTYAYVENELLDVEKKIVIQKQRWAQGYNTHIYDDLEKLKRRVRELEEQVPSLDTYYH